MTFIALIIIRLLLDEAGFLNERPGIALVGFVCAYYG
jgi:hypothetical protein